MYGLVLVVSSSNDISVRKRMTIGMSVFACIAVGAFYGGRGIYRHRKAKKAARIAATMNTKEEEPIVQPIAPVIKDIVPTPEPEPEPSSVAPVVVENPKEKEEKEEIVEETPKEEEKVEIIHKEEENSAAESDEQYHPWWIGVKEISLFLSQEETEKLDTMFPATCKFR